MTAKPDLIKVGRQGVQVRGTRIPASFFRHQQPGKRFVVLAGGERQLMHVPANELAMIRKIYREYRAGKGTPGRGKTRN